METARIQTVLRLPPELMERVKRSARKEKCSFNSYVERILDRAVGPVFPTLPPEFQVSKEIRDFARQDAETMKDTLTGTAKYNEDSKVQMERKIFGTGDGILSKTVGNFIQTLSDFNSNALEGEDWFFLKGHYRRALGGWIQANGYTVDEVQSNSDLELDVCCFVVICKIFQHALCKVDHDTGMIFIWFRYTAGCHVGISDCFNFFYTALFGATVKSCEQVVQGVYNFCRRMTA